MDGGLGLNSAKEFTKRRKRAAYKIVLNEEVVLDLLGLSVG